MGDEQGKRGARELAALWTGWWLALTVLWVLLVGTVERSEVIAGAVAAAVAATAATSVLAPPGGRFRPRTRWLVSLGGLPWVTVRDTASLFAALWRHLVLRRPVEGRFRAVHFAWDGHGPRAVARRALAKAAGSLAPNTYVVGIDEDEDVILVHQLVPRAEITRDADPLGLR